MAALVREAVALSGLEGLGVPRVVRFGRLPGSGRPFMLRELVGAKPAELIERGDRAPSSRSRARPNSSRCCTARGFCTAT